MTFESNQLVTLLDVEHLEHHQDPAGDCVDCDERPATHGDRCLSCYEHAVLQQTMHIFQRQLERLEFRPPSWRNDLDIYEDDDRDDVLCVDCSMRPAERERRCVPCFENFVTAEAIECIARRREETALSMSVF